jgi:hypothetical protein
LQSIAKKEEASTSSFFGSCTKQIPARKFLPGENFLLSTLPPWTAKGIFPWLSRRWSLAASGTVFFGTPFVFIPAKESSHASFSR